MSHSPYFEFKRNYGGTRPKQTTSTTTHAPRTIASILQSRRPYSSTSSSSLSTSKWRPSYSRPKAPVKYAPAYGSSSSSSLMRNINRLKRPSYQCRRLIVPENGYVIGGKDCTDLNGKRTPGTTCKFSCNAGFSLIGQSTLRCGPRGWNGSSPRCKKATCHSLNAGEGMIIEPIHCLAGDIRPGTKCDISCWQNYVFEQGSDKGTSIICKRGGGWVSNQFILILFPFSTIW